MLAFATAALPRLGLADAQAASLVTFGVVASGIVGVAAMLALRRRPEALRIAQGLR